MAKSSTRRARTYPRRRFHRGGRRSFRLPLAVIAGFVPIITNSFRAFQARGLSGPDSGSSEFIRTLTGFDPWGAQAAQPRPGFQAWQLRYGAMPIVLGMLVHWIASRIGINRMLGMAGVPIIRI